MASAHFQHRVEYPDNRGITLIEVAETLLAHDRVVRMLPSVIERAIPGLLIEKIDIVLTQAEEGSLFEDFGVLIWATYQKQITHAVDEAAMAMTGAPIPEEYKAIISFLILLLFLAGAVWLFSKFSSKKDGVNIKGDYNTVLNITAGKLNITSDELDGIIQASIKGPNKKALGKAAQRFFRPAQRNGLGRVNVPGVSEISPQAVSEVPTDVEIEASKEDPTTVPMPNVGVSIRATDIDRREQGWHGVIESRRFGP